MSDQANIEFIFPHIHYDKTWDVSDGSSLWSVFINNNIAEPLVRIDHRSNYFPALAESWTFSSDRKKLMLKISNKYKFHDGSAITADDVCKSLIRSLESQKHVHADLYGALESRNGKPAIDCLDGQIIFNFRDITNGVLYDLTLPEFSVTPPQYSPTANNDKQLIKNLSGPYRVTEFLPDHITMEAFSGHTLITVNSVHNVSIREIVEPLDAKKYYEGHENVVLIASDYSSGMLYSKLDGKRILSKEALTEFLLPNLTNEYFRDKETVRAFRSLLSEVRQDIEINSDLASKTNQIFALGSPIRLDGFVDKPSNSEIERLKGRRFEILVPDWISGSPIPGEIAHAASKRGVQIDIVKVTVSDLVQRIKMKSFDFVYLYSGVSSADPIAEVTYLLQNKLLNLAEGDPKYFELLEKAKHERDEAKYFSWLRQIHASLLESGRIYPIIHTRMLYLAKPNISISNYSDFDGSFNIWDWSIK